MRGSSTGSESESNKWRGGISGVGELDVNLCCGNVIIITKQSSYFKMRLISQQCTMVRKYCIRSTSVGKPLPSRGQKTTLQQRCANDSPLSFRWHISRAIQFSHDCTSLCRDVGNIHPTSFPKPALISTRSRTRDSRCRRFVQSTRSAKIPPFKIPYLYDSSIWPLNRFYSS